MLASASEPTMVPLRIHLFGPFEVWLNDRPLPRLRSRKSQWLLALLALRQGAEVEREWLAGLLWPERVDRQALRNCLAELRRALGKEAVRLRSPTAHTLSLDLAGAVVDLVAFDAAIGRGDSLSLAEAVGLYRGPLLEGWAEEWAFQERQVREQAYLAALERLAAQARGSGEWARAEGYLRRAAAADPLRESVQGALMEVLAAEGNYAAALLTYRELRLRLHRELNTEPASETQALFQWLREEARRLQEGSAARPGSPLTAPPVPSRQTSAPEIPGLVTDPAPVTERSPAAPAVKGGRGRRSRRRPGRALLPAAPAASLAQDEDARAARLPDPLGTATRPGDTLPQRLTRFFGRELEIERLCAMLRDRETLLVTLTGPGGSGKSSLALQTARRRLAAGAGATAPGAPGGAERDLGSQAHGSLACWFVSLLDLADPRLILDKIRNRLRLSRLPLEEPLEQIVAFLSGQPSLLVLDNFEHLVEGGAEMVGKLLERVEGLTVLVTSRRRLDLPGEREFPVAPLPVPQEAPDPWLAALGQQPSPSPGAGKQDPGALVQYPSVQLFVDRAQAVRPDFQMTAQNAAAVASLCRRLEGLPLAIELAAARSGVLTPQQMLDRLEQRFELLVSRQRGADPRHRSLRAALDWSYQLLSPELQGFFARLSVFSGGWTAAAAEAVCDEPRALEYLERLRECSLVQAMETVGGAAAIQVHGVPGEAVMRFYLLETLREYGAEQLTEEERGALARRHAQFFLALAETAEPELTRPDQLLWLDRLEREHDNMRAALAWSVESGELDLGLRLGSALQEFWIPRGHAKEGRAQLLRLLAQPGAAAPTTARARGLSAAGVLTLFRGELDAARALYEESLAIWRRLEDRAGIAMVLYRLGQLAADQWDWTTARARVEESLAIWRAQEDRAGIANVLSLLAEICGQEGDPAAARVLIEESVALWRALGDRGRLMAGLDSLALAAMMQGDLDAARRAVEESLAVARELGHGPGIAGALARLGHLAGWKEDWPAARAFYEQSLPLWRELDHKQGLFDTLGYLGLALGILGEFAAADALFEELLALARAENWSIYIAKSLVSLGWCAAGLGRWEEAAAHSAEALRLARSGEYDDIIQIGAALIVLASVAVARGRPARATRLLGAAETLFARSTHRNHPVAGRILERNASAARAQMEAAEYEAAWAAGQAATLEQIIAEALEESPAG